MKRLIVFVVLTFVLHILSHGQCTSCYPGTVSLTNYASILGYNNTATGSSAFAAGKNSQALGNYSIALGYSAIANHDYSYAFGRNLFSMVPNSFTIGSYLETHGSEAVVIGTGYDNSNRLINKNPSSMMIGFESTAPTLFISRSLSSLSVKNRTGKVAIGNLMNGLGVVEVEAKLHIKADEGENADIYLQAYDWNSSAFASFKIGNEIHGIDAHGTYGLIFNSKTNYLFGEGNVGLGVLDPTEKLEVEGTIKTKGFKMPQTGIQLGYVLTTDQNGNAMWAPPQEQSLWFPNESGNIYRLNSNVGIGMVDPLSMLEVKGQVSIGYHVNNLNEYNLVVKGKVGVGTFAPETELDVVGKIKATEFQLLNGNLNGNILQCDNDGNATWVDPSEINDGDWTLLANNIYVESNRYVGIGTSTPTQALDIVGNMKISGDITGGRTNWEPLKLFAGTNENDGAYITMNSNYSNEASLKLFARGTTGNIEFHNNNRQIMSVRGDNNVYIGDPLNQSDLIVYGEIKSNLVRVTSNIPWYDFVFKDDYELMPLMQLEQFVKKHHHLPDMPTEQQVHDEGLDIAEMNALLLKKVEELTLYVIELKKENEEIRGEIYKLKAE